MDYLSELRRQGFHQADDHRDSDGRVQFDCDLYRGTPNEVTIQVYAADRQALQFEVMPTLEVVLPLIDEMVDGLGEIDADLAQIILFRGRLGLHFWSRGINNEFTAVYARSDETWVFQGFGEIFADD
ncbi:MULTISPECIES: hypothetical protein [unclassified Variovorax]|jgi:hypothetical protein|uniref:hypothetical protein n=1 Tax=unclassified Variovorax TaxID=663243 RepID=UPI000F7ED5B3|nr:MULTISPECIES: hypothetical protein [unclassified Variovorax]RSZ30622.1 hypothetical protein EJO70_32240 [Variovorax sp. 553]RSZ31268.1 hypothetical protein EJO71_32525 [Variovorax sp. 679]